MSEYDEADSVMMQDLPRDKPARAPRAKRAPVPQPVNAVSPAEAIRALADLIEVLIGTMPSDARDEAEKFIALARRV